jgi:uncharacterized protein YlxW (UPF0749 family)
MPPDPDLVRHRADKLLPEEQTAGVDDAQGLAETVLEDSAARADRRSGSANVEHRRSEDTVDSVPRTDARVIELQSEIDQLTRKLAEADGEPERVEEITSLLRDLRAKLAEASRAVRAPRER